VFEQILARTTTLGEAVQTKRMTLTGRPAAIERMFTAIGFPPDQIETLQTMRAG
jgi:hypothetical protein